MPSPNFIGITDVRTSISRPANSNWKPPSCGNRFSAIFSLERILKRLTMASRCAWISAGTSCIRGGSSTVAGSQAVVALGGGAITPQSAQYYRITTRVVGPRNTRSYVEVIVN